MHTVLLTSLFPPDTSTAAQYSKLLASKLAHTNIAILAYGVFPESVPGVVIYTVSKRGGKLLLVYQCLRKLLRLRPQVLIVQNGPSSELPALLLSYLVRVKIIFTISDLPAAHNPRSWIQKKIFTALQVRSDVTIKLPADTTVFLPPEKLPFTPTDPKIIIAQTLWWQQHIAQIESV